MTNKENLTKISLVVGIILSITLIINTSLSAYVLYTSSFQASTAAVGESLDIAIRTDTGRPSPLRRVLNTAQDWVSSYYVGGVSKTNAETGITISVTGSNVQSSGSVTYYIEGRDSTGAGQPYRFLWGNGTSITVGGASLSPSNQTSIEDHLEAMGLSITASHTINYYVYAKSVVQGNSGEYLTCTLDKTLFDSVNYEYGATVTDTYQVSASGDDVHTLESYDWFSSTGSYLRIGDYSDTFYDYAAAVRFLDLDIDQGTDLDSAELKLYVHSGYGTCTMEVFAEDTDSAGAISTRSAFLAASRTSESVQWTPATYVVDTWKTINVTAPVQEVLDRGGFSSGSNMRLFLEDASSGWGGTRNYHNYDAYDSSSTHAAKLVITYMGYSASWYVIPPLSVINMPATLDVVAVLSVFAAAAVYVHQKHKERGKK